MKRVYLQEAKRPKLSSAEIEQRVAAATVDQVMMGAVS